MDSQAFVVQYFELALRDSLDAGPAVDKLRLIAEMMSLSLSVSSTEITDGGWLMTVSGTRL